MSKLLLIARQDNSGLGNQTRALAEMLHPERLLIIDSTPFNGHDQHPEWYEDYERLTIKGFPKDVHMLRALKGMTHLLTCEIAYNYSIFKYARAQGIKSFLQCNYEFLDYAQTPRLPQPDMFLMPSYWYLDHMKKKYPNVEYLPPPFHPESFLNNYKTNLDRKGKKRRFVHVIGKSATHDRNGTHDLLSALQYTVGDFELVIRAQKELPEYHSPDHRVTYDYRNLDTPQELYSDFDALIYPRRYGGLCLPMNEALLSGLPVIMTDISPNNEALPEEWLVKANHAGILAAKTMVDYYSADHLALANKLDWLCSLTDTEMQAEKLKAARMGRKYTPESLKPEYERIMRL